MNDFTFARAQLANQAAVLRYVAALHPEWTTAEFVAAAVEAGYPANSARNRFHESRATDLENGQQRKLPDGRLIDL